jgi:hypothetical protein
MERHFQREVINEIYVLKGDDEMEEIKGFTGYFINTDGEIFNRHGRQLRATKNQDGCLKIILRKDNKNHYFTVHHLVYRQFKKEYTDELFFIDGNKENCSIDNLVSINELLEFYRKNKKSV